MVNKFCSKRNSGKTNTDFGSCSRLPKGNRLQRQRSCQKLGWKNFPKNVPWLSQQYSRPLLSIKVANWSILHHMGTKGHQLQCQCSCQKMCWKEFPKNVPLLSQLCSMPLVSIKVANRSIVQHMGTKGDRQQCRCLCQKFGVEGISKMSHDFTNNVPGQ